MHLTQSGTRLSSLEGDNLSGWVFCFIFPKEGRMNIADENKQIKNRLTKPELTELAAYLYMRYEARKSLPPRSETPIIETVKGKVSL